jgi:hypothetical protein
MPANIFLDPKDFTENKERAQAWTPAAQGEACKFFNETPTTHGSVQTASIDERNYKNLLKEVLGLTEKDRAKWHSVISNSRNERVRVIYVQPHVLHEVTTVRYCLMVQLTAQGKALRNIEDDFLPLITAGMKMKMQLEMTNLPGGNGTVLSHNFGPMNEALIQKDEGERLRGVMDYKAGVMSGNHEGRINHHIKVMPPVSSRK